MDLPRQAFAIAIGVLVGGLARGQADEPTSARDYYERGLVRERDKEIEGALADYSEAVELDPQFLNAWFTRSSLYADQEEYTEAIADLSKVIELKPGDYPALFNRGLYREYIRDYDEAIADYTEILDGDADFSRFVAGREDGLAHAHHYRGRVYQWYKHDDLKAVADYTEALRLDPGIEMVHYRRGDAYHALGEYANAEEDYSAALARDPDYPNLLNTWARQLSTCPDPKFRDGERAVELATKANEKSGWKRPECVGTLAAAYAESGRFDEAVEWQEKALELLGDKIVEQREAMQNRLELYRSRHPFREEASR